MEEELKDYANFKTDNINLILATKFSEILNIDTRDNNTFHKLYKFDPT